MLIVAVQVFRMWLLNKRYREHGNPLLGERGPRAQRWSWALTGICAVVLVGMFLFQAIPHH
ncbi:hypothetical protein QDR37_14295 [Amnibacterium sp. CER49]|uniref:hypothetical protein n=1 Tax=Amnibacterium sp. CER49 TaxID=3039161 RepID=UPI00244A492C|nr:hypothetical protein [Amnibacterium sp. CER49]MDH2445120.1 hypothetical protein [Amnibacterium sp. CER49]